MSISEKTLIPVSLVIVLVGAVFWLSNLYANTEHLAKTITRIEAKQDEYNAALQSIDKRLSNIEGRLGVKDN